jgi:hypothetical protein
MATEEPQTEVAPATLRKWVVDVPGVQPLPKKTVEAETEAGALAAYLAALGMSRLPNFPRIVPAPEPESADFSEGL